MNIKNFNDETEYFLNFFSKLRINCNNEELLKKIIQINKNNSKTRYCNPNYHLQEFRSQVFESKIWQLCLYLKYRKSTYHLALSIFDFFTGMCFIELNEVTLVPYVCLVIASKLNENYLESLTLKEIPSIVRDADINTLNVIEKSILSELQFEFMIGTPFDNIFNLCHFVEISNSSNNEDIKKFIKQTFSLINMVVINYDSNQYDPFMLALSCLMITSELNNINFQYDKIIKTVIGKKQICDDFFNLFFECIEFIKNYMKTILKKID